MSTHLPLRLLRRQLHRQCLLDPLLSRSFSSTPTCERHNSPSPDRSVTLKAMRLQQKGGRPSRVVQEEQLSDERNVPQDVGLVPGTFVHAPLRLRWEWTPFSPLRTRLWYEWKWATSRVTAWYQLWRFRRALTARPVMHWFANREQLRFIAVEKYKHLNESFARADTKAISDLCLPGVAEKFQKRIKSRPAGLTMDWSLNGEPDCRIVSNLASPLSLPGYEQTGIHQIIFRIRSSQTLKVQNDKPFEKPSQVVEYLVLQRQFIHGSDKKWKIWGFTDYSTPDSIQSSEELARAMNEYSTA